MVGILFYDSTNSQVPNREAYQVHLMISCITGMQRTMLAPVTVAGFFEDCHSLSFSVMAS